VVTGMRVVLITASGPGGQVDIGVRSDVTAAELVMSLGTVLGVGIAGTIAEHHAPPRPGVPRGLRVRLDIDAPLADSGVVDGDMIILKGAAEPAGTSGPAGVAEAGGLSGTVAGFEPAGVFEVAGPAGSFGSARLAGEGGSEFR
jgi:hypothetical protein